MHGHGHKPGAKRGGKRKHKNAPRATTEPIRIMARRPDAAIPNAERPRPVASARPLPLAVERPPRGAKESERRSAPEPVAVARRSARIVRAPAHDTDDAERERLRLLEKLRAAQGRTEISRAVNQLIAAGISVPLEQELQLQLLEHVDEAQVRAAMHALTQLFLEQAPMKKTLLQDRLRRLEEYAEEAQTREAAAALRRLLRDLPEPQAQGDDTARASR